jgi:hypothetical protein
MDDFHRRRNLELRASLDANPNTRTGYLAALGYIREEAARLDELKTNLARGSV